MHWTEPATADDSHAELEKKLWDATNQLLAGAALKPSEYSPTVLGLIFLKGAQASRLFLQEQTPKMAAPPILDPACGSGGMFIQSARFVEAHKSNRSLTPALSQGAREYSGNPTAEISVHGQDQWAWGAHLRRAQRARRVRQRRKLPNQRVTDTARLARLNLAVHGLSGDIKQGNTYYEDLQDSVGRFDFVLANPPFNVSKIDKERLAGDPRYPFGTPRTDNGNYLFRQLDRVHRDFTPAQIEFIAPARLYGRKYFASLL